MKNNGLSESVIVTAASSPDVWSAMKTYLRSAVKPKKKDELVQGIQTFWETLTAENVGSLLTMSIECYHT